MNVSNKSKKKYNWKQGRKPFVDSKRVHLHLANSQIASASELIARAKKLDKHMHLTLAYLVREGLDATIKQYNTLLDKAECGELHLKKR